MSRIFATLLGLLLTGPAFAQSAGTLNLLGPSSTPPAPQILRVDQLNDPINAALTAKADVANPVFTGTLTAPVGAFTTLTASASVSGVGFTALLAPYAPLTSPTFTGTVTGAAAVFSGNVTLGANSLLISGPNITLGGANGTLGISSGGTGGIQLKTTNGVQFSIANSSAAAINSVRVIGGISGQPATIQAVGDAAAVLNISAGTGGTAGQVNIKTQFTTIAGGLQTIVNPVYVSGAAINPGSVNKPLFWQDTTISGVIDTGSAAWNFLRTNDAASITGISSAPGILNIDHEMNTGFDGARNSVTIRSQKNAAAATGGNYVYTGLTLLGSYLAGDGSIGNYLGSSVLFNPDITCQMDYSPSCNNTEFDIRLRAGMHAISKVNLIVNYGISDAVKGGTTDAALMFMASTTVAPGTGRGNNIFQVGSELYAWPLDPNVTTSSIIKAQVNTVGNQGLNGFPAQTYAGYGVDFMPVYLRNYAWRTTGHWIDAVGQEFIGPGSITYSTTGLSISATKVTEQTAVVVAGGVGYVAGDELVDANGGLWSVATLAGTAVATVTNLRPGFASSCPGAGAPTTGGYGLGATLTISCSAAATQVSIQPAGGDVLMAGLATSAPATHCALWANAGVVTRTTCP